MSETFTICICGGGSGAHVMAGLAAVHARTETRVLTLYEDEADVWNRKMKEGDFTVSVWNPDGTKEKVKAKPRLVTKHAEKAMSGADIIIICVPAFAHHQYLEAIAPFVKRDTAIIGLPGQPGFEFQCFHVLGDKAGTCAILNYESLPWACRLVEFGREVDLLGTKTSLIGSKVVGESQCPADPSLLLQSLLGDHPVLTQASGYLEVSLMTKGVAHPALMYGHWKDWDGQPLRKRPLFYQGLSEYAAAVLCSISDEMVETASAIRRLRPEFTLDNVEHLENWFIRNYKHVVKDRTNLYTAMKTNRAYNGMVHPMKEVSPGQWMPDFGHRYLAEDVPFALAVIKGLAQIAQLPTPFTDKVLTWAQDRLGKEYLVGSELKGKDLKETRAPQAFGYNTLDDLLSIV